MNKTAKALIHLQIGKYIDANCIQKYRIYILIYPEILTNIADYFKRAVNWTRYIHIQCMVILEKKHRTAYMYILEQNAFQNIDVSYTGTGP